MRVSRRFLLAGVAIVALLPVRAGTVIVRAAAQPSAQAKLPTGINIVSTSASTQANAWVSFGQQFEDGAVSSGSRPILLLNGTPLADQAIDNEIAWPSGNLRRCNFTARVPSLRGPIGTATLLTFSVAAGTQDHSSYLAAASFLTWAMGSGWNVEYDVTIDGNVWSMDAVTCLGTSNVGYWKRSAICTEFITWGKLKSGAKVHPDLVAKFEVRVFSSGGTIQNVRTVAIVENVYMNVHNYYPVEDITLKQNGTEVWSRHQVSPNATLTLSAHGYGNGIYYSNGNYYNPTGGVGFSTDKPVWGSTPTYGGWYIESKGSLLRIDGASGTRGGGLCPWRIDSLVLPQAPVANKPLPLAPWQQMGGYPRGWGHSRINLTATGDLSGMTFTIVGSTSDGTNTETLTGPNNTTIWSNKIWTGRITSITPSGSSSATVSVGVNGFPNLVNPPGTWRLIPYNFIPNCRLYNITWHINQARYAPNYDRTGLISSGFMFNYRFDLFQDQSGYLAADLTGVDGVSQGTSALYGQPESIDANPNQYNQSMGYLLYEGQAGERIELGAISGWDFHWLWAQSNVARAADAHRNIMERAKHMGGGEWPIWYRDRNTDVIFSPVDWPNMGQGSQMLPGPDAIGWGQAGWSMVSPEVSHSSARVRTAALITGDFWCVESQLAAAIYYAWYQASGYAGSGTRKLFGWNETRGIAWGWKQAIQIMECYPDTMYTSNLLIAKTVLSAWFNYNQTSVYNGFLVPGNVDPWDLVPSSGPGSRGDYHWVWSGRGVAPGATGDFQMHYLAHALAQGYDNGVLNSQGQAWAEWVFDFGYNLVTKTSEVNPRYAWSYFRPTMTANNRSFNGLAEYWQYCQNTLDPTSYPIAHNLLFPQLYGSSITPSAVSGTGIAITSLRAEFYPTHVGARIAGNGGVARVTAFVDARTVTCDVITPFANTRAIPAGRWYITYGNPGPNTDANLNLTRSNTAGGLEAAFTLYGVLGCLGSVASRRDDARGIQPTYRTWLANSGFPFNDRAVNRQSYPRYMIESR